MILYVNGDSHSAGAEIVRTFAFAEDDPQYAHLKRRPHPECLKNSYGHWLSRRLDAHLICDAESGASNSRILRTTKEFLTNRIHWDDILVVIGWSTWEREEWLHKGEYYQVNSSGKDSIPAELQERYKKWLLTDNSNENIWHDRIHELHMDLYKKGIKHLFFNSYSYFNAKLDTVDWHNCYIHPYTPSETYWNFLKTKGFITRNNGLHYGRSAHRSWANRLTNGLKSRNIIV